MSFEGHLGPKDGTERCLIRHLFAPTLLSEEVLIFISGIGSHCWGFHINVNTLQERGQEQEPRPKVLP